MVSAETGSVWFTGSSFLCVHPRCNISKSLLSGAGLGWDHDDARERILQILVLRSFAAFSADGSNSLLCDIDDSISMLALWITRVFGDGHSLKPYTHLNLRVDDFDARGMCIPRPTYLSCLTEDRSRNKRRPNFVLENDLSRASVLRMRWQM